MKKTCMLILLSLYFALAEAQESALKAGLDLNFWLHSPHPGGFRETWIPPYGGFKLSYETRLGKKFSFTYNLEMARRKVKVSENNALSPASTLMRISFVPEVRYYPLKSHTSSDSWNQGLFIQAGVRMLSFYTFKNAYGRFSHFSIGADLSGDNSFLGIGIKHPVSSKMGMEMNMNVSPYNLIMQDSWQTFQAGFKIYRIFGKPACKEKKSVKP